MVDSPLGGYQRLFRKGKLLPDLMLAEARDLIQHQVQARANMDQRAVQMSGFFSAAAAVLASIDYQNHVWILAPSAVLFVVAAIVMVVAARSSDLYFPGREPAWWLQAPDNFEDSAAFAWTMDGLNESIQLNHKLNGRKANITNAGLTIGILGAVAAVLAGLLG